MGEALRVDLHVCGSIQEVNRGFISWIGHPLKKKKKQIVWNASCVPGTS